MISPSFRLFSIIGIVSCLLPLSALGQETTSLVIGNCSPTGSTDLEYVGRGAGTGYALNYSRYKMRAYKGAQLTTVSMQFDGSAKGQVFLSQSIDDAPFYTQPFEAKKGWNDIVLDTPYTIDGTELTFGFLFDELSSGTVLVGEALVEGHEYVNRGDGWALHNGGSGRLTATLSGDALPKHDVALAGLYVPTFVRTGSADASAIFDIANLGTATVTSLELSVHNDAASSSAAPASTITVSTDGLSIAPRSKASVAFPLCLEDDGDYHLWFSVTQVNGGDDAAPSDNSSEKYEVVAREAFTPRNVLLEVFSTERCTNCPAGHETIRTALGSAPHLIELTHHAGFFTDKFTVDESVEYEWFYKSPEYNTTFAPAFMTDRTAWASLPDYYPYGTPVAMSLSSKSLKAAYNAAAAVPALAHISVLPVYDASQRSLAIDVEGTALVATAGYDRPTLNVFLVEDNVFSKTQENSFGSYYHPHLVRQCLTTAWGEPFAPGGSIARHYDVVLPADWDASQMSVVAYVANYNPKSSADCRVMNAEEARFADAIVGLGSVLADDSATPLYNITGQHSSRSRLSQGVYISAGEQGRKSLVK